MAKKYSVQMENDAVVSVEVDGVTYTNPDEIPDAGDRQKIQAMVSRSTAADPEESGQDELDREMAKDLREMRKQSASMPKLMVAIFLGVACNVLYAESAETARTAELGGTAVAAVGAHRTDWLWAAHYGVFMHFLPGDARGLALVREFDVDAPTAAVDLTALIAELQAHHLVVDG